MPNWNSETPELVELNMRYDPEETERRARMTLGEIARELVQPYLVLTPEQVEEEWPELSDADVQEIVRISRGFTVQWL